MGLNMLCGPSILYLGFSIIQIIIDIYKGLYNTTFIKFIVTILFTLFLNILCQSGLTAISWIIVFIPFISMTIITTLLLFVFGLDPTKGNLDYKIINHNNSFSSNSGGIWRVVFPNGSFEDITIKNGQFIMLDKSFKLLNTSPVTFKWPDGTIHRIDSINKDGIIEWKTDSTSTEYNNIIWIPQNIKNINNINNRTNPTNIDPCPPNVSPSQYKLYYGDYCMTGNQLNNLDANSSGTFRVSYYDGTTEQIMLNNGSYISNGETYTILDTNPLTIRWPNGTLQTLNILDSNYVKWVTNSDESKYSTILWEPINI